MLSQVLPSRDADHGDFPKDIEQYHEQFLKNGVAIIADFLSPRAVNKILLQTEALLPHCYHSRLVGNAYLSEIDKNLPQDHPYNMTEETALATLGFDEIPSGHLLRDVYLNSKLRQMVASIVGEKELFFYACPMGALNISVMRHGDYLRWHFDQCDFVVSIPLQDPIGGGKFQFVKDIRSKENPNYDGVRQVISGHHPDIKELIVNTGSIIVFRGRNTIHRVTEIYGETPRLVALLAYANTPNCDSSDHLKMIRYGRTKAKNVS